MPMITIRRTVKQSVLLSLAASALLLAVPGARADEAPTAAGAEERIFGARLGAGWRATDLDGSRTMLSPYDPLVSGPLFGFDLLYLRPSFGTLNIEAGYLGEDNWNAELHYSHAADLKVDAAASQVLADRGHRNLPAPLTSPTIIPLDSNPGAENETSRENASASLKVRIPTYPAHLNASGRVSTLKGTQQMTWYGHSCGSGRARGCHIDSESRSLDQQTQEYSLGADGHFGPIDLAYTHTAQTYSDRAFDPVDYYGNHGTSSPAGWYAHDVNPDLASASDAAKLNTNLTNRAVLSLAFDRQVTRNDDAGISRRDQHAAATLNYVFSREASLVARYAYDSEKTLHLSAAAAKARIAVNTDHFNRGETHQHAIFPKDAAHTGELVLRYAVGHDVETKARLRFRARESVDTFFKAQGVFTLNPRRTEEILASLGGSFRAAEALTLEGELGGSTTSNPSYAIDTTNLVRYALSATWAPDPAFSLSTAYRGFHGKNRDTLSLMRAYGYLPALDPYFGRTVNGNAVMVIATLVPAETVTVSCTYSYADNGIEQDMYFGSPGVSNSTTHMATVNPAGYLAPDTRWVGREEFADLRAAWAPTRQLTLTAEGMRVTGKEHYDPLFAKSADLRAISAEDFTKYLTSLRAAYAFTPQFTMALTGFWAKYENATRADENGKVLGAAAELAVSW